MRDAIDLDETQDRTSEQIDKRTLTRDAERQIMGRDFSKSEKGEIGEQAMLNDARRQGHKVLMEHADNSNARGFDGVFWDAKERQLIVAEAKNYQEGTSVSEAHLSAFSDKHLDSNIDAARDAVRRSDLSKEEKISAHAQLTHKTFRTDLYVPSGVNVSDSARQRLYSLGGDASIRQFDGRGIWNQERRIAGGQMS